MKSRNPGMSLQALGQLPKKGEAAEAVGMGTDTAGMKIRGENHCRCWNTLENVHTPENKQAHSVPNHPFGGSPCGGGGSCRRGSISPDVLLGCSS